MRDVEKLREKIQFSLDDRQIVGLSVSAVLLLGGVFMIGMLAGRRTAPVAAATEIAVGDDSSLQSSVPGLQPEKVAPVAVVKPEKVAAEKPEKPAAPAVEKAEKPADAAAEKPSDKREKALDAAVEKAAARPSEKGADKLARTAVAAPRAPITVDPPPRPVAVSGLAPMVLASPPRDAGAFTVQIGASQDRAESQRIEAKARGAGLKPYVVTADLGAKGLWYRVRVGAFQDKDSAARYRKDVERELRGNAVVMPTH